MGEMHFTALSTIITMPRPLGYSRFRPAAGSLMLRHRRPPIQTKNAAAPQRHRRRSLWQPHRMFNIQRPVAALPAPSAAALQAHQQVLSGGSGGTDCAPNSSTVECSCGGGAGITDTIRAEPLPKCYCTCAAAAHNLTAPAPDHGGPWCSLLCSTTAWNAHCQPVCGC